MTAETTTDDLHAICPNCVSEESLADEERCCLSCGADLIVVADTYSCELLLDLLRPRAEAAADVALVFDKAMDEAIRRERPMRPPPATIYDLDIAGPAAPRGIGDDANPTGLCLACGGDGALGGRQCPDCSGARWVR